MTLLKEINKTIGIKIETGGFRKTGYLLLLCVIVVLTVEMVYNNDNVCSRFANARLYEWLIYLGVFAIAVYINNRLLVPLFLLRNKLFGYVISMSLCVVLFMMVIISAQNILYDISENQGLIPLFLNIAGNMLSLGLIILSISVFPLFRNWMENSRLMAEQEKTMAEAELQQLKNQINPHFLFNTLNNANIKAEQEPQLAHDILLRLGGLLKYQLYESSQEKVLMRNEISFLRNYLELESTRRESLNYEICTDGIVESISMYPLLFIPFVENAVKHSANVKGSANIHIMFSVSGNRLYFRCENTKTEGRKPNGCGGLGLKNVKRRLELLFGKKYTLSVAEQENKYIVNLCVTP